MRFTGNLSVFNSVFSIGSLHLVVPTHNRSSLQNLLGMPAAEVGDSVMWVLSVLCSCVLDSGSQSSALIWIPRAYSSLFADGILEPEDLDYLKGLVPEGRTVHLVRKVNLEFLDKVSVFCVPSGPGAPVNLYMLDVGDNLIYIDTVSTQYTPGPNWVGCKLLFSGKQFAPSSRVIARDMRQIDSHSLTVSASVTKFMRGRKFCNEDKDYENKLDYNFVVRGRTEMILENLEHSTAVTDSLEEPYNTVMRLLLARNDKLLRLSLLALHHYLRYTSRLIGATSIVENLQIYKGTKLTNTCIHSIMGLLTCALLLSHNRYNGFTFNNSFRGSRTTLNYLRRLIFAYGISVLPRDTDELASLFRIIKGLPKHMKHPIITLLRLIVENNEDSYRNTVEMLDEIISDHNLEIRASRISTRRLEHHISTKIYYTDVTFIH